MLNSFVRWLLFGTKNLDVKRKRDEDSKKSVNLVSQQTLHNFRTDRQITYQPVSDAGFKTTTGTPLSVGLALTIHKKTSSKGLVNILSQLQIGSSYDKIDNIEKRIACWIAELMTTTGGFCLSFFVLRGKSVYFAAENIDFLENTADGQSTLQGTMLVFNQNHDSDSDTPFLVYDPLRIPDVVFPVDVYTNFRNHSSVAARSITVANFEFHSNEPLIRKYETYDMAWFMASFAHIYRGLLSGEVNPEEQSTVLGDTVEQHTIFCKKL